MEKDNNGVKEPSVGYGQPLNFDNVWLMFKETDKKFQQTDNIIKEFYSLFTTQWGKLMESLVNGDIVNLLKARGIDVNDTSQRVKGNFHGTSYEFDIIARNGKEVVVIEVKTTLLTKDVRNFIKKLHKIKVWKPELSDNIIYGAVAYLTAESSSDVMAANKVLFVIRATGNSSSITNEEDFKPVNF